jgi:hypothetical protein
MFNKICSEEEFYSHKPDWLYFKLHKWISENDMTDQEKIDNPKFYVAKGYLKKFEYKEAAQLAWDGASKEEKEDTLRLPNFDADIFYQIFGMDVRKQESALKIDLHNLTKEQLIEELQKRMESDNND